jgi:hypothetical protein
MTLFLDQGIFALGMAMGVLALVLVLSLMIAYADEVPSLIAFAVLPESLPADTRDAELARRAGYPVCQSPYNRRMRSILFDAGRELTLPANLKIESVY